MTMTLSINDHDVPGCPRIEWRSASPAPFTDGSQYTFTRQAARDFLARAGDRPIVLDLEDYPGMTGAGRAEHIAAYDTALTLLRRHDRMRHARRPIILYGIEPMDAAGVRELLPLFDWADGIAIGAYIANSPDCVRDGLRIGTSLGSDLLDCVRRAFMWRREAPDVRRVYHVSDKYVFRDLDPSDPNEPVRTLTDGAVAKIGQTAGWAADEGLFHEAWYWLPREDAVDERVVKIFEGRPA